MKASPVVSFVIVSWNVRDYVLKCLESIERHVRVPHEVIVVDNASDDDVVTAIRQRWEAVTIVALERNFGFATANCRGAELARGEWIFFLNPDTELIEDSATALLRKSSDPSIGCLAPRLLNADQTIQLSVRKFPTVVDQAIILLKLRWLLGWTPRMRRYLDRSTLSLQTGADVEQVMGAAMLLRRAAYDSVGGFDSGFPNWFEEVDLCLRLHRRGWRIVYDPTTSVVHFGGTSFGQVRSLRKQRWWIRGIQKYAHAHWPRWQAWIIDILAPVSFGLTVLQSIIKPR